MAIAIALLLVGLVGGFLAGFLGIGGGIVYIAILPIFLKQAGIPNNELVQFIIANSIFGTMIAAISGNIVHLKYNRFYKKEVALVGLAGTISALATLYFVVHTSWYSQELFNLVIVLLLIVILYKTLKNSSRKFRFVREVSFDQGKLSLSGISGGFIAASSGLGGGAIIVPLLNLGLKMNIKKAKSISLGVIFITSVVITIYNTMINAPQTIEVTNYGYIIPSIVLPMSLGALISTPFGVVISRKSPAFLIAYIFSAFIALVIFKKSLELYQFLD
ncbi:MAG: sulfite exporter TauE/SafE family protein [Bacteroidetes bacterium]|nr:sulfite exporter TauE/SafE family protein [Bacteroidota bacterium]